jgi:hypothetical protein
MTKAAEAPLNYRFSGHETFQLRYAWLPKAIGMIDDPNLDFVNDEVAMVEMGLGKNMVRALRFWVQATGVAEPNSNEFSVTPFGRSLLSEKKGYDPFLEDLQTIWLLHWKLSTHASEPLFAWDFLLNRWHQEIVKSRVIEAFRIEAEAMERRLSSVTIEQHFDVFLHTYVPTRGKKGAILEENLDSPFTQLNLIEEVDRPIPGETGKREVAYAFRREEKPEVTPALFAYCLNDFWSKRHPREKSVTFREVAVGHGSPDLIFKLPESDIRSRLEVIQRDSSGAFHFEESVARQAVFRLGEPDPAQLLERIYEQEPEGV